MPPRNMRGGKSYKKGKNTPPETGSKYIGRGEGTDFARALRMLGDRRVLCFCNDGVERVCKIRQALCKGPKRHKIEVNDIVLVSFREFEEGSEATVTTETGAAHASGRKEIADIVECYDRSNWRDIKKETGLHPNLFPLSSTVSANAGDDIFEGEGDDDAAAAAEPDEELNVDDI